MYSVDNLCPSGISSSSKRQLCFHQEPLLKSPEHLELGLGGELGTGWAEGRGSHPEAGGRTEPPTLHTPVRKPACAW